MPTSDRRSEHAPLAAYRELAPHAALRDRVECYWIAAGDRDARDVLPDGCVDFLFDAAAGAAGARLVGAMTRPLAVPAGSSDLVAVRFRPGGAAATQVPAVLPFVVYHGERSWRGPRSLRDCIALGDDDGSGPAAGSIRVLLPELPFVLLDLSGLDEAAVARRRYSAIADLTVRFLQFLRLRSAVDAAADIARWHLLVAGVLAHPRGSDVLTALFSWLVASEPDPVLTVRTIMTRIHEGDPPLEKALRVFREVLEQQGMQQGLQEGFVSGLRALVAEQLQVRFGALPHDAEEQLARADAPTLQEWGRRLVTAPALADVFAPA
jgi:hypothetical protein